MMKRARFTEEQIIGVSNEADSGRSRVRASNIKIDY
jgi:hypothetical protein